MSAAKPNEKHAEALMAFCTKVEIAAAEAKQEAKQPEDLFSYRLNKTNLSARKLKAATAADYMLLKDVFDRALTLEVSLGSNPYIEIEQGKIKGDLAAGIGRIHKRADTTELALNITIDKALVIEQLGLNETLYNCLFYLFEQNLSTQLGASLIALDKQLFEKPGAAAAGSPPGDKPTVIVVSDADIYFAGDMLTIVGEGRLDEAVKALKPLSTTMQEGIKEYRESMKSPTLVGHEFQCLTPLHLSGQWKKKGSSSLEKILAQHFANICILYTANRSTFDNDAPSDSVYNNSERTTTLSLKEEPTSVIQTEELINLANWLQSGKETDRRTVFQNIVARELYSDDPKINYNSFISLLKDLLKDAKLHYQMFLEGKITKHFEEVQKVVGYVDDVNKKISDAIDSATKGLTDTLLATVGVLVLTVLAALVKKDTSIAIFRISMQFYSGYIIFYAAYRMASIFHSYFLLSRDAEKKMADYRVILGTDKIASLRSPLTNRRIQFHVWFWATLALYLALAGGILWAGTKGPQFLTDRGILSPVPTQTSASPSPTPPATNSEPPK
jgi:hypothetical protein